MLPKYTISWVGGSEEGVLNDMVVENALVCFEIRKVGSRRLC